jgi:GT2 family glycosyltransferase
MISPGTTLSIVIATQNQLNALKFTLLTLRDQQPDVPFEVIVVEQGCDAETEKFLAGVAEMGQIRTIVDDSEAGRTAARNRGARASRGRYLAFLDPGMVLGPHWWEAPVRTMDNDPLVGAVGGKVLVQDGRIDHAGVALLEWQGGRGARLTGRSIHAGRAADAPGSMRPLLVQGLAGEAMLVRASAFFAVGGFDEGLGREFGSVKALAEAEPAGLDLSLRLGARGWLRVYRPESIMTRLRVAEADARRDLRRDELMAANDQALMTANWRGRVQPDFRVPADGPVEPLPGSQIRAYIEPQAAFPASAYHAGVHPDSVRDPALAPPASVVVVTYNVLDCTRMCVESLLEHTDPRHELIFVDNGSTDGTPAYLEGLAHDHEHVRVILNPDNKGYAGGNNLGMAMAKGRHVVLLNNDTVVTAGWLETLLEAAERHPRAGLLGAVTNNISGLQRLGSVPYDEEGLAGLDAFAADNARDNAGQVEHALRLTGFCLLIKRELLARLGGLDEAFGRGNFEDNDYCLRAHLAGYEALVVKDSFVHHFGSRSFAAAGVDYQKQIVRQWDIFKAKWGIPAGTPFNAPVDLGEILARGFDPGRHFHPLPAVPQAPARRVVAVPAQG